MTNLAVVIVNWNTRALTLDALQTLTDDIAIQGPSSTRIWVVDNNSADGSVAAIRASFPQVNIIESEQNLGFAGGNNAALRAIGFGDDEVDPDTLPQAVYLLNSDTRTHSGATNELFQTLFEIKDAGVVGARLTFADGTFQHSAFAFPGLVQLWVDLLPVPARLHHSRVNGRYPRDLYEGEEPFPVGHTLGATMMIRREVIQQTGMFDEQFFMYAEEVDWSWRIQKAGWRIYCVPTAHVTHLGGQSTQQVKPQSILNLWKSRLRLFKKHYPPLKRWLARRMVGLGMRWKIRQARQAYKKREISAKEQDILIETYRQVMQL